MSVESPSKRTQEQPIEVSVVDSLVEQHGRAQTVVLPLLQAIQSHYRYLPEEALRRVCEITDITPATIAGVSSFYSQFRHKPTGRHLVSVCHGTACHVKGAELVFESIRRDLGLSDEEDTDADDEFTVQQVSCLGCCTLAPVIQIDSVTYGHLTPETAPGAIEDFRHLERSGVVAERFEPAREGAEGLAEIRIGVGSCCVAGGSSEVRRALEEAVRELAVPAAIKPVGCVGMCHQTPLVEVARQGQSSAMYARVGPNDARRIVRHHFKPKGIVRRIKAKLSSSIDHLLTDEWWEPVTRHAIDVRDAPVCAFVGRQKRIATEHCGQVDPLDLEDYVARDGFAALERCIKALDPDAVIDAVKESGLRGRGGAGFPTAAKWSAVRAAAGEPKYVICNGDEGDPGAFMDRMILESFPYRVIEGIAIAAFAVGATEGHIYIRAEYPLALRRIRDALQRCEERGYVGENVLGSGFSLRLRITEGAGAFVCGEESALLACIEGRRGSPKLRPPYPAESGLWGQPTSVNNVETYALVPWIIRRGPKEFAALGTDSSTGTKVFALAGKIVRGGLIEVPMGITVREIVEEIGGGVADGRHFKAVQIGGPSGGCIPAELADTPIDYESLAAEGGMMGSGGLVVIDDSDCMVDMARYFLGFTQRESCGKCTFCRVGTRRMLDILDRLCTGEAKPNDLDELEELSLSVKRGSLCGLGRSAPNPVLSTLRHFREEYLAHLEGRCPAGKCRAIISYRVTDECIGCTKCAQRCPTDAIAMTPYEKHEIDAEKCIRCGTCKEVCPVDAVMVE